MGTRVRNWMKALRTSRKQDVTLHRRMMLYLMFMLLAAAGLLVMVFVSRGLVLNADDRMVWKLQTRLDQVYEQTSSMLDNYEGYSLNMARQLGASIDSQMEGRKGFQSEFQDSPEKLLQLQKSIYDDLYTTILMGGSSGVYAVLDATVNSSLPEADHSRSGLYLRLQNPGVELVASSDLALFRGSAEIAREKGIELHNRWNLEFDTLLVPRYEDMMAESSDALAEGLSGADEMFWADKMVLQDTWEEVILLCTPIKGASGEKYGVCGVELSNLFFRNAYPVQGNEYGTILTVMAPVKDGELRLDQGMAGNTEGTWLKGLEVMEQSIGKKYTTYHSVNGDYVGLQRTLPVVDEEGKEWVVATLVPKDSCMSYIRKYRYMTLACIFLFVLVMLYIASKLSRKFVQPILRGFEEIKGAKAVKNDGEPGDSESHIAELEELKKFIRSKRESVRISNLPENIEEMLQEFIERVKKLTPAENLLLSYYVKDYSLEEFANKMVISMGTAKKHNTNLNRKLEVTSRSQLMVYIELFRRCNRLGDIIKETK